jgi:hypothetical protein
MQKRIVLAALMGLILVAVVATPALAQHPEVVAIVNAASGQALGYRGGSTSGSGVIVSIYGSALSQQGECKATTIPYPLSLCGVTVGTMPGTFVPVYWQLLYVGPNQINALVTTPIPTPVIEVGTLSPPYSAGGASFTLSQICCFVPGLFTVPISDCPVTGAVY